MYNIHNLHPVYKTGGEKTIEKQLEPPLDNFRESPTLSTNATPCTVTPRGGYDQGPPQRGGYDQGPPQRGGYDQGPPQRGGYDQGPPQRGGYDQGPPQRGGYDQGPPQRGGYQAGGQSN
uniref:Uncharacterized protein n=1 Tax=Oncorhynchus tshawytscha TaxID=74940 RepID=A0AAZ3SIS2_ONCTS